MVVALQTLLGYALFCWSGSHLFKVKEIFKLVVASYQCGASVT